MFMIRGPRSSANFEKIKMYCLHNRTRALFDRYAKH